MKHEDSAHNDDQKKINEHVVYLYTCSKLSLTVYANSLTEQQRDLSRKHLSQYLCSRKNGISQRARKAVRSKIIKNKDGKQG